MRDLTAAHRRRRARAATSASTPSGCSTTDLPWTRMRQVYRLLGLVRRYGPGPVDTACGRALDLDVVAVTKIASMLEKATENTPAPPPRAASGVASARFARDPAEYRPGHTVLADRHRRRRRRAGDPAVTKPVVQDPICPDLKQVLGALKLGQMLDTLPERLTLARQQNCPTPASSNSSSPTRSPAATPTPPARAPAPPGSTPACGWTPGTTPPRSATTSTLWNELTSLRFLDGPHGAAHPRATRGWLTLRSPSIRVCRIVHAGRV